MLIATSLNSRVCQVRRSNPTIRCLHICIEICLGMPFLNFSIHSSSVVLLLHLGYFSLNMVPRLCLHIYFMFSTNNIYYYDTVDILLFTYLFTILYYWNLYSLHAIVSSIYKWSLAYNGLTYIFFLVMVWKKYELSWHHSWKFDFFPPVSDM